MVQHGGGHAYHARYPLSVNTRTEHYREANWPHTYNKGPQDCDHVQVMPATTSHVDHEDRQFGTMPQSYTLDT